MIDYLPKIKFAAKLSGVLFAGGAIYCTLVEHPSMLECGTKAAADHWHGMFKRAAPFQAGLSLLSASSSLLVYHFNKEASYLYSGLILSSILPFTFAFMQPTNKILLNESNDKGSEKTMFLLKKWGKLHAVRSVLGIIAASFLIYGS